MPTHTVWVKPMLFLEHGGLKVFHTYHDDDIDHGMNQYWFTLNPRCGVVYHDCNGNPCRNVFDVRELATWIPPVRPQKHISTDDTPENRTAWEQYCQQEHDAIITAIVHAIDSGELLQLMGKPKNPD